MLEIDGVGMGVNWMHFIEATLAAENKPKLPPPTQTTPQNPVVPPQITVQVSQDSDPSKPTNEDINSATTLIQQLAAQYQPPPPDITVDDPTTKAAQAAIQTAQTKYDNAVTNEQNKQTALVNAQSSATATPADIQKAQTDYTNAQNATTQAGKELEVTTDAGYMIAYSQQADADKPAVASTQTAANNAFAALQKVMPNADPNNPPSASDCKTPQQLAALDAWQKANAKASVASSREAADIENSNLAYAQLQSHASDKTYADAMTAGVANVNQQLKPLGLEVSAPPPIDPATAQTNLTSAADDANYANACLSAATDSSNLADVQQTYDAVSGKFGPTVMSTTVAQQQTLLTKAQTAAQTSGNYLQMLYDQRNLATAQTNYNTAITTSQTWHKQNANSPVMQPQVDVDVTNASAALTKAQTQAGLSHDAFVAAYGSSLASQYDDEANGLQNTYDHRAMCTVNDPTPLEIKGVKTIASSLHAASQRLSDSVNDRATKLQLQAAQTTQTQAKNTLQTIQQQSDGWNAQHAPKTPLLSPYVDGQHGTAGNLALTATTVPYAINPYTQQLSDARDKLNAANNAVNQLQLMSEGAHQQVLFDQFQAGLSDNLLNPVTDSDKSDYAKALDQFYSSHRSEMSQSMLDQAGSETNNGAAYNFGKMSETDQKNLIGTALGLQQIPNAPKGSLQYNGDALNSINTVYNEIHKVGGDNAQVSVLPIVYAAKDTGVTTTALFKVDGNGGTNYIDESGSKYSGIDDYINHNQLSSDGTVDIATGHNSDGSLQIRESAAHHDGFFEGMLHELGGSNLNLGVMLGGVALDLIGGVLDATGVGLPLGAVLNVAGTSMVYSSMAASMANSADDLFNRATHDQSISPLDAGARSDYINLIPVGAAAAEKLTAKVTSTELFSKVASSVGGDSAKLGAGLNKTASTFTKVSAFGGAIDASGQLGYDIATGNDKAISGDVKSLVTNVVLLKGADVAKVATNGLIRTTGGSFAAKPMDGSAGNLSLGDQSVGVQRLASGGTRSDTLTLNRNAATLDGQNITVDRDGTLHVGDQTLTYDGIPVRVVTRDNSGGYTGKGVPKGPTAVLDSDGNITVLNPTRNAKSGQPTVEQIPTGERVTVGESGSLDLSENLSLSHPDDVKTPSEIQQTVSQLAGKNAAASSSTTEPDPVTQQTPRQPTTTVDETSDPLTQQVTRNAVSNLSEVTTNSARVVSDEQRSSTEVRERQQEADQDIDLSIRSNQRSSEQNAIAWQAVDDPFAANGGAGGAKTNEPMTFQQRVAQTILNATDEAPPPSRSNVGNGAGVPVGSQALRTPSQTLETQDVDGRTLYVVRNNSASSLAEASPSTLLGPDGRPLASAADDALAPEAAPQSLRAPGTASGPLVFIEGSPEANMAPELANALNTPVFVAARGALAADGTPRAGTTNGAFVRFDPATRTTNTTSAFVLSRSGLLIPDDGTMPATERPLASSESGAYRDGVYVLKDPNRATDDEASNAAGKPHQTQPGDNAKPRVETDNGDNVENDGTAFAHPQTDETGAQNANSPGLLARLQMRFGGAPLPNEVSALAEQSGTLSQQLRMLNDNGWRVKMGRKGDGSRVDAKRKRVTIDGGLRDPGSATYTLAHEAQHAVEAIKGLTGLDYSSKKSFTRKALEAEARAQINAFEARYEINLAGGGDIARNVRLPEGIQRVADEWTHESDNYSEVDRLMDAFADAPVSGTHGQTYTEFYNAAYDQHAGAVKSDAKGPGRVMAEPETNEADGAGETSQVPTTIEGLQAQLNRISNVTASLNNALARLPFKHVMRIEDADALPEMGAHAFMLQDNLSSEFGSGTEPIALRFSSPDKTTHEHAQTLADVTGVSVITQRPGAPTSWETLTPQPMHGGLDGPVEFDEATDTFHVVNPDGTRRLIDPEDHLGQVLGAGAYKTAIQLGNKTLIVYRDLEDQSHWDEEFGEALPVDEPTDMMEKAQQLQDLGAPHVAKIDGVTSIHGFDTLVMDTYRTADRTALNSTSIRIGPDHAPVLTPVYDTSLLNQRSIDSLTATKNWMLEKQIDIEDLQFLVRPDGTFDLADVQEIMPDQAPNPRNLERIDDYIGLAQARLAQSTGGKSTPAAPTSGNTAPAPKPATGGTHAPNAPQHPPLFPAPATTPAPAVAPSAAETAATWLDAHGLRTLQRIDGTHVGSPSELANKAGPGAHILVAQHVDRPDTGNEHSQPVLVAELQTDAHGKLVRPGTMPASLKTALSPTSKNAHSARANYDFYISPVPADELASFGGASTIKAWDSRQNKEQSWTTAASGHAIDAQVTADIGALADAPHFKRPKLAVEAATTTGQRIYAVEQKSGKLLGYAERDAAYDWKYHEKVGIANASIEPQDLAAAFRRNIGKLTVGRAGRRGVTFIVSDRDPAAVSRVGGFQPAEAKDPTAPEQKPHRTAGDIGQSAIAHASRNARVGAARLRGKQQAALVAAAHGTPAVEPHLLPSKESTRSVVDFSGQNILHLQRAIDQKSIGNDYTIYVYDVKGPLTDALDSPRGIIAARGDELRWFDDAQQARDIGNDGVSLDEMPIGHGTYGANMHFLVTRVKPDEFFQRTKATQFAALDVSAQVLGEQKDALAATAATSTSFRRLADSVRRSHTKTSKAADALLEELQPAATGGKGASREDRVKAATSQALAIDLYQPGVSTTTVVESNLRNGRAKLDHWFPGMRSIQAYNERRTAPPEQRLTLEGDPTVVMADTTMWKKLGNRLFVARDVSSMPSRNAPIPVKTWARRFGVANVANLRMIQLFVRSDAPVQDRVAPMSRAFTLRDNPTLATQMVERYGGVMPIVTLVVDPHSLAAAAGQQHDTEFLREVRALGDQSTATFDEANGVIKPKDGSGGETLAIDDLNKLHGWLSAASEAGFAIRLETAPSRALVSPKDQRFQAGTNDSYHDFVRTFSALDDWATQNPGKEAPNVMVTFHGWDAVPESVPGAGHAELLKAVLARDSLKWVHMGLSYGTHGADFVANQDLTTALAKQIVDYALKSPGQLARLHGSDALTRVFERPDAQTFADQQQLLFAEVERIGRAKRMTPEALDKLHSQLYEGNTTTFLNGARKLTIEHAKQAWEQPGNGPGGKTEKLARQFSLRWMNDIGGQLTVSRVTTEPAPQAAAGSAPQAAAAPSPVDHWRAVAAQPALQNDGAKPLSVNRKIAAQLGTEAIPEAQRAAAELHALRVHSPVGGWRSRLRSGGLVVAGAPAAGVLGANALNLLHTFSSEGLHHASTSLFVGTRTARVFQALHQGAVTSLKNGDPRVFDGAVNRIERSLRAQLGPNGFDDARVEQLSVLAAEGKVKAAQLRAMNSDGTITFDDAVKHTKAIAADMLAQMQGVMGGTSLKRLHHGNPRHAIGSIGRAAAIVGYSATAAANFATFYGHPALAPALTTFGAVLGGTYTGIVYLSSARELNADKRSRVARFVNSAGDYVTSAAGFASGLTQIGEGHPVLGALAMTSATILGAGRLHTHFPNATRPLERLPTALALAPVAIFSATLIQSLFFSSGSSPPPPNSGTGTGHAGLLPQPTGSQNPTTHLAPGLLPTTLPSVGPVVPTAVPTVVPTTGANGTPGTPAPSTSTKSAPATGSTPSTPSTPAPYLVVEGDSLWVIATSHRQSLLDAAHIPAAQQQKMSSGEQDAQAFDEILQLNPQITHPAQINPGQQIVVG